MINEFINGFVSVFNLYFMGKIVGIAVMLLAGLILLTFLFEMMGFLKDENKF